MTTNLNTTVPERRESPWIRFAKFLLLAAFIVAVYLLALSMVHHRFFQGSRLDRYGHVRQ
jgi:hypothetical protein